MKKTRPVGLGFGLGLRIEKNNSALGFRLRILVFMAQDFGLLGLGWGARKIRGYFT